MRPRRRVENGTPAVLSLGKVCTDYGHSSAQTSGHLPQLIKIGRINTMQYGKLFADRCPRIINRIIQRDYKYYNIVTT